MARMDPYTKNVVAVYLSLAVYQNIEQNIKNVGIAERKQVEKQCRADSLKQQFSIQSPLHIFSQNTCITKKMHTGVCILNCFVLSLLSCFLVFLLFHYSYMLLHFIPLHTATIPN